MNPRIIVGELTETLRYLDDAEDSVCAPERTPRAACESLDRAREILLRVRDHVKNGSGKPRPKRTGR